MTARDVSALLRWLAEREQQFGLLNTGNVTIVHPAKAELQAVRRWITRRRKRKETR